MTFIILDLVRNLDKMADESKHSNIPILDKDGVTFVNWRIRTEIWADNTNISSKHKAGKILMKFPDRAFEHIKDIPREV